LEIEDSPTWLDVQEVLLDRPAAIYARYGLIHI